MNENSDSSITCVIGNNKYRNYLVYNIVYRYVKKEKIKFGAVIGNPYPYYEYITDNIYIKYDESIMENYLKNIQCIYEKSNGKIDRNILIVDSNTIDFNSKSWKYILENYRMYKMNIIIILDKILEINIDILKEYVNMIYIVKQIINEYEHLDKIYQLFCKEKYDKETFICTYIKCTDIILDTMLIHLNTNDKYLGNSIFKYKIDITLPKMVFNTYKMYEQNKIYKQRCILSDIINV